MAVVDACAKIVGNRSGFGEGSGKKKKKIKEKIKENKKKKDEHNYRRVGRRDEKFSRRAKTFSTDKSDESYFSVTAYYHRQMHTHARPWQTRLHTIRNVYRM